MVKKFSKFKNPKSMFIFVLTNGSEKGLEDNTGSLYDINEIILENLSCQNAPHLREIMKIIVVQAFRYNVTRDMIKN